MARLVECLNCGATRRLVITRGWELQAAECARCGYVGWAEARTLTETLRRALRETTLERRRRLAPAVW
jgi:Zn ribbon nucleic-acid-binding protein